MLIAGVDEAGRGPVLGPLVMAGACCEERHEHKLKEIGVRDSKLLQPEVREALFDKISSICAYKIISITPDIIDEHLLSTSSNLNMLEAKTTGEIINELKPGLCYIDLPEKNPDRYGGYIRKILKSKTRLVLEHKADSKYLIVGAASILAKVTRDRYIEFLKQKFGEDFGSGYMSDPKTQRFLERHWNNPTVNFIRKQWMTWKNLKRSKEQHSLLDY